MQRDVQLDLTVPLVTWVNITSHAQHNCDTHAGSNSPDCWWQVATPDWTRYLIAATTSSIVVTPTFELPQLSYSLAAVTAPIALTQTFDVVEADYAVSALDPELVELARTCNWRMDGQIPPRVLSVADTDAITNAKQKFHRRHAVAEKLEFATTPTSTKILVDAVTVTHVYLTATCSEGECLMHTCEHSIDTCSLQLIMRFGERQLLVRRALNRQQFGLRLNVL